ncbi:hypothetical protein TRVA0_051S00144 [Trichomonascus vanleenenianus]|uniref:cyclin family protein n=1 Tax=Trichomonascus vanleenenianus TaxID=2268995 RepID=UPI003EC96DCB
MTQIYHPQPIRRLTGSTNDLERTLSRQIEAEYHSDILKHMRSMEESTAPNASMIDQQPEITWYMRPYLIDMLIDYHHHYRLQPETLYLAVNLVDRYCSMRIIYQRHYQLVGLTALWIASKYEDKKSRTPTKSDLRKMCMDNYEEDMFVQMELHILSTIGWSIGHSTVESFLKLSLGADNLTTSVAAVSSFLGEVSLYSKAFMEFLPSTIASSAHTLALIILGFYPAVPSFVSKQVLECIQLLKEAMKTPSAALVRKYSSKQHFEAAIIVEEYVAKEKQQATQITFPPTPPPMLSTCPSSIASQMTPVTPASSVSTPIYTPTKSDLHIVPPPRAPFRKSVASSVGSDGEYLTPPCTPADAIAAAANAAAVAARNYSVPMECSRF